MGARVVILVKVKDPEKLGAYSKAAGETVAAHGGEFVVRGKVVETLCGPGGHDVHVAIDFPDVETAQTWYRSEAYQALIPLRDAGADMSFTLVETP